MKDWDLTALQSMGLVLVIGLGQTGVAASKWCLKNGLSVRVADTRVQPPGLADLNGYVDSALLQFSLGLNKFSHSITEGVGTIIISPGISINDPLITSILDLAAEQQIQIIGEIELFAISLNILANQGYTPKILAVTGTNGKTTVTDMASQVISANGYSVVAAGNISPSAIQALQNAIDTDSLPQVWILELSSFQLVTTHSLRVDAAAILNISQDHLDWHAGFENYVSAKLGLIKLSRHCVINRDDSFLIQRFNQYVESRQGITSFSTFGDSLPEIIGDIGIKTINDMQWFCHMQALNDIEMLMPVNAMLLRGMHNALNAQAAMLLANNIGISTQDCLHAIRSYLGQNHRMQFVGRFNEIDYVNDSKGTNVGASVAAIYSMDTPVILIAGGLAKGQDFKPLIRAIKDKVKHVVLIGQDASQIANQIVGVDYSFADSMASAVEKASSQAVKGDTVLLSPACASMDMFKNYGQRGAAFIDAVNQLALHNGQVLQPC